MKKMPFTYTVLRYMHDTTTREFVNVGVVVSCPQARYAAAKMNMRYGRLSQMFRGFNGKHYRNVVGYVQELFDKIRQRVAGEMDLGNHPKTAQDLAYSVIVKDDSSFQWAPTMGSGLTEDPSGLLGSLYERFVARYDESVSVGYGGRKDEQVWQSFRAELSKQGILERFGEKVICVPNDEIRFSHAWQNSCWNCLEAVSFDLQQEHRIKEKAYAWVGRADSIRSAAKGGEDCKIYYLVGRPPLDTAQGAYGQALKILGETSVEHEIVEEDGAAVWADEMARLVEAHDRAVSGSV